MTAFQDGIGLLFTVDTLEFLARGGRIGRAQAWAGELLQVKPILTIADGEILPVKRVRGNRKAFLEFQRRFEDGRRSTVRRSASASRTRTRLNVSTRLRAMVEDVRPSAEIEVAGMLGPVVGAHAGPGTVGFFYWDAGQ